MKGIRRGLIIGTLMGILLMAGMVYAEQIWYQKIRSEIIIPRSITMSFNKGSLNFGEVAMGESSERDITVTNTNDYPVDLKWTMAVSDGWLEECTWEMYLGGQELLMDNGVITLQPGGSQTVTYIVHNVGETAPIGGPVTYSWTLRFYIEG